MIGLWNIRNHSDNWSVMSLFHVQDIPYILFLPDIWLKTIQYVIHIRKYLQTLHWYDLSPVYPRFTIWGYLYQLLFYVRYTRLDAQLHQNPHGLILAETFLRYVCEIDKYLDSSDSRASVQLYQHDVRRLDVVQPILDSFLQELASAKISSRQKYEILQIVARYRRGCSKYLFEWAQKSNANDELEHVIKSKKQLAGQLMPTWCNILSTYYSVESHLAKEIAQLFSQLAMYTQVIDDVIDIPHDYRIHAENIALASIQQNHIEWQELVGFLDEKAPHAIFFGELKTIAPCAHQQLSTIRNDYLAEIFKYSSNPELMKEMRSVLYRLKLFQH